MMENRTDHRPTVGQSEQIYTLADLQKAKKRRETLQGSLDRGIKVLTPLENAMREELGGSLPSNPQDLPDSEYKTKLLQWIDLLDRFQKASNEETHIKNYLRSVSRGRAA